MKARFFKFSEDDMSVKQIQGIGLTEFKIYSIPNKGDDFRIEYGNGTSLYGVVNSITYIVDVERKEVIYDIYLGEFGG